MLAPVLLADASGYGKLVKGIFQANENARVSADYLKYSRASYFKYE